MDVWTTKSGEEILIREMTDGHLLNAIMMIERNYRRICGTEPVDLVKETKRALTTGDFEQLRSAIPSCELPTNNNFNRGTHGDSSFMLDGLPSSSEKPLPLGMGVCHEYIRTPIWKNYAALHNEAYASLLDEATRRGLHCGFRESTR